MDGRRLRDTQPHRISDATMLFIYSSEVQLARTGKVGEGDSPFRKRSRTLDSHRLWGKPGVLGSCLFLFVDSAEVCGQIEQLAVSPSCYSLDLPQMLPYIQDKLYCIV